MPRFPIAIIVVAQFFGTSLWFSANAVGDSLARAWHLSVADIGSLTSAVQLGFIVGTLGFALSGLADRFRPAGSSPCAVRSALSQTRPLHC